MSIKPTTATKKARTPRAVKPAVAAKVAATPKVAAPAVIEPVVAKPVVAQSVTAKPVAAKPMVTKPVSAKPVIAKPAAPVLPSVAPAPATPKVAAVRPQSVSSPFTPTFKENLMATAFETNPEKLAEAMKAGVAQFTSMTNGKAAMEQITAKSKEAVESSMKSLDEMTEMARGNVEALLASARTAQAGIEAMVAHVSEVSKKSFEEASAIAKSMTSAKTPNEMMQIQSEFAKAQYDSAVTEFSKMTEMMVKLSGEAMEPMQNRIALATDKMKTLFNK